MLNRRGGGAHPRRQKDTGSTARSGASVLRRRSVLMQRRCNSRVAVPGHLVGGAPMVHRLSGDQQHGHEPADQQPRAPSGALTVTMEVAEYHSCPVAECLAGRSGRGHCHEHASPRIIAIMQRVTVYVLFIAFLTGWVPSHSYDPSTALLVQSARAHQAAGHGHHRSVVGPCAATGGHGGGSHVFSCGGGGLLSSFSMAPAPPVMALRLFGNPLHRYRPPVLEQPYPPPKARFA